MKRISKKELAAQVAELESSVEWLLVFAIKGRNPDPAPELISRIIHQKEKDLECL